MTATAAVAPPVVAAAVRRLAAAQLLGSIGDGGFSVTSALFFTRVLGLAPVQVGLGLTLAWAVGSLATVPLGTAADRYGARGTATVLAVVTAAAVAALPAATSFGPFLTVAATYAVAQSGLGAVRQALLIGLVPADGRLAARARLQQVGNAGLAAGAAIGGAALLVDRPAAYVAVLALDAVGFLAVAAALRSLPRLPQPAVVAAGGRARVLRDRRYLTAAALNTVLLLYMPMLGVVLPLWIVERTAAPPAMAAVVFLLNTVGVMAGQGRAARAVTDTPTAVRALALAGLGLLLACLTFALAASPGDPVEAAALLTVGAVLQVAAELQLAAGGWHLSYALAPDTAHGAYQGVWGAGIPVARTIGPAMLTGAVLTGGALGWAALGGAFLLAGLAVRLPATGRAALR